MPAYYKHIGQQSQFIIINERKYNTAAAMFNVIRVQLFIILSWKAILFGLSTGPYQCGAGTWRAPRPATAACHSCPLPLLPAVARCCVLHSVCTECNANVFGCVQIK